MINPGQFVLELVLIVTALLVSRRLPNGWHRRFVFGFAALAAAVNFVFYYVAVGPLLASRGFDRSVLIGTMIFETIRWGVLAYVLSRLAVRLQGSGLAQAFALLGRTKRLGLVL